MIDCQKVRQQINLYLDNEATPEINQFIQEHLTTCSSCRKLFAQEQHLEQKLVEIISKPGLDNDRLWDKAVNSITVSKSERPRIYNLRYIAPLASAALVMIVLGAFLLFQPSSTPVLLADAAQEHQLLINTPEPEEQLAVKTDSLETLAEYFSEQYKFNITGCECGMATCKCNIKGGRMCSLSKKPAVHILIDYQGVPISLFVLSSKDLTAFPDAQSHLKQCHKIYQAKVKDFNCAMVRLPDNILCAVSSVKPELLKELITDTEENIKRCKCGTEGR